MFNNQIKMQRFEPVYQSKNSINQKFPNIYYIVFDSYTSLNSLKKYWGYQDKHLDFFLTTKRFNYSLDGKTNFANTPYCMASYLNMRWELVEGKNQRKDFYSSLVSIQNNSVVTFLKSKKYKISNLSLFRTIDENNFYFFFPEVNIWGNSLPFLFFRGIRKVVDPYPTVTCNYNIINELIKQAKNNVLDNNHHFTYAHLMIPHAPYLLDSLGNIQNQDVNPEKLLFLSQLKYSTKIMIYLISYLVKVDPSSVIVIQGDHGYRCLELASDRIEESKTIFNSLYLGGNKLSSDTINYLNNPINTFRIILNTYFKMNIRLVKK